MFADQLQILFIKVLLFPRTWTLLVAPPTSTLLNFFVFVDNKTFANLPDKL